MFLSEEKLHLIYVVKERGDEIKRISSTIDTSGMTMFELIGEFEAMLRAMGYPLEFGSKLEIVGANEVVASKSAKEFSDGCAACSPVDEEEAHLDGIGDDLEEVPK